MLIIRYRQIMLMTVAVLKRLTLWSLLLSVQRVHAGSVREDWLCPYASERERHRDHRRVRSLSPSSPHGAVHETCPPDVGPPSIQEDSFVLSVGDEPWRQRFVHARLVRVGSPLRTVSVLPPAGGCGNDSRATVAWTAPGGRCRVAINAGFFNTTTDACLGNLVSQGVEMLNSGGIQNANFGIKEDGSLFFGYLDDRPLTDFRQLVTGVIWLVRGMRSYVRDSLRAESADVQETGSLDYFVNVRSARSAVGHDKDGRLILLQVDGKTGLRGVNLYEMADLLIRVGAVNAINLDGGGSSTIVQDGVVLNIPSDVREEGGIAYSVPRDVSSVICVHDVPCASPYCSHHGDCVGGHCVCEGRWAGRACDLLLCGNSNCSSHGECTEGGCVCRAGWHGDDCQTPCASRTFGVGCDGECRCQNGAVCDPTDGSCHCPPGYTGARCQRACDYGFYGQGCRQLCFCENSCGCHHITGNCNVTSTWAGSSSLLHVGQCLANQIVQKKYLIFDHEQEYKLWVVVVVVLCVVSAVSVILNISLLCAPSGWRTSRRSDHRRSISALSSSVITSDSELDISMPMLERKKDVT